MKWRNLINLAGRRHSRLPSTGGQLVYAVGDIHGRADLFDEILAVIRLDRLTQPSDAITKLVLLGDYVDRGPASAQVLARIATLTALHPAQVCALKGNHEALMLKFLKEPKDGRPWLDFGGAETLRSYQISVPEPSEPPEVLALAAAALDRALPGVVHELLEALALSVTVGDYMFVHAGVRPGVKLTAQKEIDLLWIREPFLSSKADFGKIVVHGHTAETTPLLRDNRVGIDTGAYATGVLTAIRLYGTDYKLLSTGSTPRHTVGD